MAFAEPFDTRFSNGEIQFSREHSGEEGAETGDGESTETGGAAANPYLTETDWRMSAACGGLVFLFTVGTALLGIYRNLQEEPLSLLSSD